MLALTLLWRNWRSGEVKLLSIALVLAVTVVTGINVFTVRLQNSLLLQSNSFIAADRVLQSSREVPQAWQAKAAELGLQQALVTEFSSMAYAGDNMQLASVKAVAANYPLRGLMETSLQPFAVLPQDIQAQRAAPAPGEVWVDSRLLPLLNVQRGDEIAIGEKSLRISRLIVREPDRGTNFSLLGVRILMNIADLKATQVIQPGSRVRYKWLLAGDDKALNTLQGWLSPQLSEHEKFDDLNSAQKQLASTLDKGQRFLLLAAVIALLLAGVAIAIAARQFSERHTDQVALLKSLGLGVNAVRRLYISQLLWLVLFTCLVGMAAGELLQQMLCALMREFLNVQLLNASYLTYLAGAAAALLAMLFFVLPPIWYLPAIAPLKVLRREISVQYFQHRWQLVLAACAILLFIYFFSGDGKLSLLLVAGLCALLAVFALSAHFLLFIGERYVAPQGSIVRLAMNSLLRNRQQSQLQIMVFASAFMLLMLLFVVRGSLLNQWRMQLPADAPNHFLVNIAKDEIPALQDILAQHHLAATPFYPMVRARLSHINGQALKGLFSELPAGVDREVNLSWSDTLADDNKITQGQWWPQLQLKPAEFAVSVEEKLAADLHLKLGDELTFSAGGVSMQARVASLRSLKWDSMRPNFYFLFSEGALENMSPMYLSSVFIPAQDKNMISDILKAMPTILVIEMDMVIERIQSVVGQISRTLELVLWLVLCGGLLVLVAAVYASLDMRMQESAILRALGCSRRRLLGSIALEFFLLGLFAGMLAAFFAQILLLCLQGLIFDMPLTLNYTLWLAGPPLAALCIMAIGLLSCRRVVYTAPMQVLRAL
ncbi:MAG: FtsX-like permease family protein [Oceanospirillaceae bacterium]|nr:FtsX-like permease family protein [Oceanospirillaceae bacterium]